jgi:excisionase family DNA binding protein
MRYDDLPELLTPKEAIAFLGISKSTLYGKLESGDIPSIKFGRRYRIPKETLLHDDPSRQPIEEATKKAANGDKPPTAQTERKPS